MKRRTGALVFAVLLIGGVGVSVADAHDLFLRPRDFVVRAGSAIQVRVLNGSFTSSEGTVTADRLIDLSIAGPAGVSKADRAAWTSRGKESGWTAPTTAAGGYVLAASLSPRTIRLTGKQFNAYLTEEGLGEVVSDRRANGAIDQAAHERYAKHVKALVRATGDVAAAGDTAFRHVFGYPAELVPLDDPYRVPARGMLRLRALVDGAPVVGQVVLAGGRTLSGARLAERTLRTDAQGLVSLKLDTRGTWYVKFIRMRAVPAEAKDSVNYESKWATITFARK